jgi:hypothetical protein
VLNAPLAKIALISSRIFADALCRADKLLKTILTRYAYSDALHIRLLTLILQAIAPRVRMEATHQGCYPSHGNAAWPFTWLDTRGGSMAQSSNQPLDEIHNAVKPGHGSTGSDESSPADSAAQPSGPKGDNPSTAEKGETQVQSGTPENALGHLNPSAPEDSNVTPGSATVK